MTPERLFGIGLIAAVSLYAGMFVLGVTLPERISNVVLRVMYPLWVAAALVAAGAVVWGIAEAAVADPADAWWWTVAILAIIGFVTVVRWMYRTIEPTLTRRRERAYDRETDRMMEEYRREKERNAD